MRMHVVTIDINGNHDQQCFILYHWELYALFPFFSFFSHRLQMFAMVAGQREREKKWVGREGRDGGGGSHEM